MKLLEVSEMEPKEVSQTYSQYQKQLEGMAKCQLIKQLGSPGVFGAAYQSPTDPKIAVKTYQLTPEYPDYQWDAYTQWLIQTMNRSHNPYFPRVHDVQIFVCAPGRGRRRVMYGVVHMEKLEPLDDNDFGQYYPFNDRDYLIKNPRQFSYPMGVYTQHFMRQARAKDPALYDAVSLIHRLADNHSFQLDTHGDNVMWRMEPGLGGSDRQLVFTDPLAW